MIKGVHTMFCSSKPEELRAFIRDKLGFPYTDVGEGWHGRSLDKGRPRLDRSGPCRVYMRTRVQT